MKDMSAECAEAALMGDEGDAALILGEGSQDGEDGDIGVESVEAMEGHGDGSIAVGIGVGIAAGAGAYGLASGVRGAQQAGQPADLKRKQRHFREYDQKFPPEQVILKLLLDFHEV